MGIILFLAVIIIIVYIVRPRSNNAPLKPPAEVKPTVNYEYYRKDFVMTKAENDFFNQLNEILGNEYYVFPQMHLSSIFGHKVNGQNWKAAFSYISQKSVDYVVCNREHRRPLLGIELDDWSHDSDARKQRDVNVEHIFKEAGLPLLRLRDVRTMSVEDIKLKLNEHLPKASTEVPIPTGAIEVNT